MCHQRVGTELEAKYRTPQNRFWDVTRRRCSEDLLDTASSSKMLQYAKFANLKVLLKHINVNRDNNPPTVVASGDCHQSTMGNCYGCGSRGGSTKKRLEEDREQVPGE